MKIDQRKLREEIDAVRKQNGVDKMGVASIDRFKEAPAGQSPLDLLPSTQSVISLGIHLTRGAMEANRQAYRTGFRPGLYSYMVFGYSHPNSILEQAAYLISKTLEEAGYIGIPIPASRPSDMMNLRGSLSHRHAAVAAGIADFGWNGLAITREVGPKIRFISIVTDAPLPPDPLQQKICQPEKCDYQCIKACPLRVFNQKEFVSLHIGDREVNYFGFKKWSCILGSYGLKKEVMGITDFQAPENPDRESFLRASSQAAREGRESERAGSCGRCMLSCPLGA